MIKAYLTIPCVMLYSPPTSILPLGTPAATRGKLGVGWHLLRVNYSVTAAYLW